MKIYDLGSLNIDYVYKVEHFVRTGETLSSADMQTFPGGKGLNQSIALARAGAQVIHGGAVGADGAFLLDIMKDSGVDVSRVKQTDSPTGHAIIQVNGDGQNCILLFTGANRKIDREYVESFLSDAEAGDILLLQNEVSALDIIFGVAHEKGMDIAFNPSPFDASILKLPLEYVKWWFCNEIEGAALFGEGTPREMADSFARKYPSARLILTLGAEGSIYKSGDEYLEQSIYPVKAVDTTAAGDTFTGYFLNAVAKGDTPAEALDIASKASSVTVSRPGASVSVPYMNEIV